MSQSVFKKIIVVLGIFFILIAISIISFYTWFDHVSTWRYCVEDFETYQADFEAVAKFCQEYVPQSKPTEDGRTIFGYNYTQEYMYCNWERIDVPEDIISKFKNIKQAFPDKDAQLDYIFCTDEQVYFSTGVYSVVYSKNGKPEYLEGVNKGTSKKICKNWYHVVRD